MRIRRGKGQIGHSTATRDGHLLADYPANGSAQMTQSGTQPFLDIRLRPPTSAGVSALLSSAFRSRELKTAPAFAACESLSGDFDGPVAALFSGPVHPPRDDAFHHRERGAIFLRRWDRAARCGAFPDPRRRA